MMIDYIAISNVLSFAFHQEIADAPRIQFDNGLNILIGENGSGKSTALEVINFIFKRVLCKPFNFNREQFSKRFLITSDERKQILTFPNTRTLSEFRLGANWDAENMPQQIRFRVKLDAIDKDNLLFLKKNIDNIYEVTGQFVDRTVPDNLFFQDVYTFDVMLISAQNTFTAELKEGSQDFGYEYLIDYGFYREMINIYNFLRPEAPLQSLNESFSLINSYRNYSAFDTSISLKDKHPSDQIDRIKKLEYQKSLNASDQKEPSIFGVVRLRVAEKHFDLMSTRLSESECEEEANKLPFIAAINETLRIVNLCCKIRLIDKRTWQYNFEFHDFKRDRNLSDINSLSAGQKAIIHLVFEAYGKGDLKGGVVIIDEPEIHLHYQFQHEYLQIIKTLNEGQKCQYILVTHSEALINSTTILRVKRFYLNDRGHTEFKSPMLSANQRMRIKILDNTRSIHAFFAKKVILVEGDTDRYFYRSVIQMLYPHLDQEIAVLFMGGCGGYSEWHKLFRQFGLKVYCIGDLDMLAKKCYPDEVSTKLTKEIEVQEFKLRKMDWEKKWLELYKRKIYILKNGDLEHYLKIEKGLNNVIEFCNTRLQDYLDDNRNEESKEVRTILESVIC